MRFFCFFGFLLLLGLSYAQTTVTAVYGATASSNTFNLYQYSTASDGTSITASARQCTVATSSSEYQGSCNGTCYTIFNNGNCVGVYHAIFSAEGTYIPGSSLHIAGSVAELIGCWSHLFVCQNNDGKPGCNLTLGYLICPLIGTPTYDCICLYKALSGLQWGSIQQTTQPCPSGYPANCTVTTITVTTTGSDAGTVTITVIITSLQVYWNGILITPDRVKIMIEINNPFPLSSNQYLGMVGMGAGKTSSASVGVTINNGKATALTFTGSNGGTFSFYWESMIDCNDSSSAKRTFTTSADVNSQTITDSDITAAGNGCSGISCVLVLIFAAFVTWCEGNGWRVNFVFYTFPVNQITSLKWDPSVGAGTGSSSSMGALTAPLFWLTVCMVLAHLWWSWKHN